MFFIICESQLIIMAKISVIFLIRAKLLQTSFVNLKFQTKLTHFYNILAK
jgi:hypothetical protein